MNCQQAQRQMDDLLDARARQLPEELNAHVRGCDECREAWTFGMEVESPRDGVLVTRANGFWRNQEAAIRRRVVAESRQVSVQRVRQTLSATAAIAITTAWLLAIHQPVEAPQLLSPPNPEVTRTAPVNATAKTDHRPSRKQLITTVRRNVHATSVTRRHRQPTRQSYIRIRVIQIASARVAPIEPTYSLPPRTLEVERIVSDDGTERIEVRPVPVVVINPFLNHLSEEDQPRGG